MNSTFYFNHLRFILLALFVSLLVKQSSAQCENVGFNKPNASLIYCVGQEVNLTTSISGQGTATITYEWFAPGSTTAITGATTNSYKIVNVTSTLKGKYTCKATVTFTPASVLPCVKTLEFDIDVISPFTFDLGADKTMCPGTTSIPLQPNVQNSNASIVYSWTSVPVGFTGNTKDITVNTTSVATESTLTLTATAGNCVFSDNVKIANVSNFTVSAGSDQTICIGTNVNLSATVSNANGFPVSYAWSGPGGFSSSSQNIALSNIQETSIYTLKSKILTCELLNNISVIVVVPRLTSTDQIVLNGENWFKKCTNISGVIKISNGIDPSLYDMVDNYEVNWGDGTPNFITTNDVFLNEPHTYLAGFYELNFIITTNNGCVLNQKYKVYVGKKPEALRIGAQSDPDGCVGKKDYFVISGKSNLNYLPGFLYDISFNDGTTYNFDFITLKDTLYHTFLKTSCGSTPTYGDNAYGVTITTKNACNPTGSYNTAAPIYISDSLKVDLEVEKDTICIFKQAIINNTTEPGSIAIDGSCNKEYKYYWTISPNTGWTTSNSSLGTLGIDYDETTSGSMSLNLIFNTPGVYKVTLNTINDGGCPATSKTKTICVEDKPIPKFELDKLTGCAPFTPVIHDTSIINSCSVYRKWEVIFDNITSPCTSQLGNYQFMDGTTSSSKNPKIMFTNRGNYTIRLKLANTCDTVTFDKQIKVLGLPIVSIPSIDSICKNGTINPRVNVTMCDNTITGYNWTFTGGTPSTSNVLNPGSISYSTDGLKNLQVIVKSGCGDVTATQTVYVKPLPPVLSPKINNVAKTLTVCIGDNVNYTSETMLQKPALYTWTGPNGLTKTTQTFSFVVTNANQAGVYKVKGTMNGCVGPEDSVTLIVKTKPTISISPTTIEICKNTSTVLLASGISTNPSTPTWAYTWSPATGITPTTGASVTANPTSTTKYTVIGSDGTCFGSQEITLTVKDIPAINNTTSSQSICSGSSTASVVWTSVMASTYRWSVSSNTGSIAGAPNSGTGNLLAMTLTNPSNTNKTIKFNVIPTSNGCDGLPFEYAIEVKPKPVLTIGALEKTIVCGGVLFKVPLFTATVSGSDFKWTLTTPNPVPPTISGVITGHNGKGQMNNLTINNSGSAPVDFKYQVTPTANSCDGSPLDFSFTVNPAPSIKDPFSNAQSMCSGSNSLEVLFSSLTPDVTYFWKINSVPIGLSAPSKLTESSTASTFSIPSFNLVNSTTAALTMEVEVKALTNGSAACPGEPKIHTITIHPTPELTAFPASPTICTGETLAITIASTPSTITSTYTWIAADVPTITGESTSIQTGGVINNTLINNGTNPQSVIYKIKPTSSAGCVGSEKSVSVLVNVKPIISINATPSSICKGNSATIVVNGTTTNTLSPTWIYTWSPVTGLSSSSGASVTASPTANQTYTIEGFDGKCKGKNTITVVVKDLPIVTNVSSSQGVCSGLNSVLVPWNSSMTSTAFSWVLKSNPGGVTGIAANTTGDLPSMNLINPTAINQDVTFSVTPTSNGCPGPVFDYTITVKPKPVLSLSPLTTSTICGGKVFLVPTFTATVSGSDFKWNLLTPNPVPSNISGVTSGHNGTGQMSNLTIGNSGASPVDFKYQVTPIANSCEGSPLDFSFTVNPAPAIAATPFFDAQELCSGALSKEVPFSSATTNVKYSWKIKTVLPNGLTATPIKTADSTSVLTSFSIPPFTFTNTNPNSISLEFEVKALTLGSAACPGTPKTHTITIHPKASVSISPLNQDLCHNENSAPIVFTSTTTSNLIYTWTNTNTSIGLTAADGVSSIASFSATNSGTTVQTATISVTPIFKTANSSCPGIPSSTVIKVLPLPALSSIPSQQLCPLETSASVSPVILPSNGSSYSWILVGDKPNVSAASTGTTPIPALKVENNSPSIKVGTYTITPVFTAGTKSCTGVSRSFTITVLPKPSVLAVSNQEKCANEKSDTVKFVTTPLTGVNVDWTNDPSIGIPSTGTNKILPQTLINTSTSAITSNFTLTPTLTNASKTCYGDQTSFSIKVNPIPVLDPISDLSVCANVEQEKISFASNVPNTTFSWTNSGDAIGMSGMTGSGSVEKFKAINATNLIKKAVIKVTPTASGCSGTPLTFNFRVKPKPKITNETSQEVCTGINNKGVVWTSDVTSPTPTFSWTSSALSSGLTISPASGTGPLGSNYVFTNAGVNPISVKFMVKATVDLCESDQFDYTLTVNPKPTMDPINVQTICGNSSFTTPVFNSNTGTNTAYNWSVQTNPSISPYLDGYPTSGTGNLVGVSISNSGSDPLTLIYDVLPISFSCPGTKQTFLLNVNPTPKVTFSLPNETICNETKSKEVTLTPIPSSATISWTASVPSSITGFTTNTGTITIPESTLKNTSDVVAKIQINAVASTTGTVCPGIATSYEITVIPSPKVNPTNDQTKCHSLQSDQVAFTGVATSYSWTNSLTTIGFSQATGTGTILAVKLTNTTNAPLSSTFIVTPKYLLNNEECLGNNDEFMITVNPRPTLDPLAPKIVCANEFFQEKLFTSNIPSASFIWENSNVLIGLSANGVTSIPSFKGINSTNGTVFSDLKVTPSFTHNSIACTGGSQTMKYSVRPITKVDNKNLKDTICSGEDSKEIPWTSNVIESTTTYTWKLLSQPDSVSGYIAEGTTTSLPSMKVYNQAKTIRALVYKVKPTSNNCLGDTSFIYTLYINPSPGLTGVSDQVICGGTATSASRFTSDVIGTIFNWKLTNKTLVPDFISGYVGSAAVSGTGDLSSVVISNSGTKAFVLEYAISTNSASGCGGAAQPLKITVNPAPVLDPVSVQTICSGKSTNAITLSSSTTGVSFNWEVISGAGNVVGVTPLSGLINTIPSYPISHTKLSKQVVKIAAFAKTSGLAVCDGRKDTIYLNINPIPALNALNDLVLCKDEKTPEVVFSGNGTNYKWQVTNAAIGLSAGNGLKISEFAGINSSVASVSSNVTVTPEFTDIVTCLGEPKNFTITVNPKPITSPVSNVVVCHNEDVVIPAFNSTTNGVVFKWYNNLTSINLASSGTGNIQTFKATNTSNSAIIESKIKVVPFYTNLGKECKGDTMPFLIKVNPIPTMLKPNDQVLCNDSISKLVAFTGTATSYAWKNNNTSIGIPSNGFKEVPSFKSLNTAIINQAQSQVALIKVVPIFTDQKACSGDTAQFTYTVHPTPVLFLPPNDTLCYNQNTKQVTFSSNLSTATFSWLNLTPSIISGLAPSGANPILSFKGTNTGNKTQVSIVKVITTANQCPSKPLNYIIVIHPRAKITLTPQFQDVCSGSPTKTVQWTSDIQNAVTKYKWSLKSNPYKVIISKTSGSDSIPKFSMNNDSSSVAIVSFNVIPSSNGCEGDTFVYSYKVLPRPKVTLIPAQTICGGKPYVSPVFKSDVSSTVFTWKLTDSLSVPKEINGYLKSGITVLPSKVIQNTGIKPYTLKYAITTSGSGCSGQSIDFNLTINPAPKVAFDLLNQTMCSASTIKSVTLSSETPNATFEWKIKTIPDSLTGVNKTSGNTIIDGLRIENTSIKPIDLQFTAKAFTQTPSESCYGSDTIYKITINPVSKVKIPIEQFVCHRSSTKSFEFTGTGTSYHWTNPTLTFGLKTATGVGTILPFSAIHSDTGSVFRTKMYVLPKYTHQSVTCDGIRDSFFLTIHPKPIIKVASATICYGKKATLEGQGASFNSTYNWSPGTGLSCISCPKPIANPLITSSYTIIGTNRYGCKDTTTTTVYVNPLPIVDAGPDTTLCRQPIQYNMVGKVEGVVKQGVWTGSPDVTTQGVYKPETNGVFKVVYTFTLPTGCENFDTTLVTVKDVTKADAGSDLIACFNDPNVTLNGLPKPGTWTGYNVSTLGIFKPIKDTIVPLVYSIGRGTCLNRDTMLFKVHPDYKISAGADKEFCFSDLAFDFTNQLYEPSLPMDKGEWTGLGITDKLKGTFKASIAGIGKHNIVFSYTHPITGCVKYDTLVAEVHPLPIPAFKIDSIVCLRSTHIIKNTTQFLNKSDWTIYPVTKYFSKEPTHKFDSVGFFDIRLIATSPFGCIDSLIKNIEVREAPIARFTRTPDSTCGLVAFENLSKGIGVDYAWNFGNGVKSTLKSPADLIYKPGIIKDTSYTIKLRIQNMCGADSMSIPIVVKPVPKIIFAPNVREGCSVLPILYANRSVGLADTLKWDFYGDGKFINSKDSLFYRNYLSDTLKSKTYLVTVIAINECGTDTAKTSILVHPNIVKAHFQPDKLEGCTDLVVKFTQYSMGNTFHVWNFGDGTTTKDLHPNHVYKKPGSYKVFLAVNNGCSYDTMRVTINVYQKPKIDFTKSYDTLCLKGVFSFKSISTEKLAYKWYFGDGDSSLMKDPQHTYLSAGKYQVDLMVSNSDNYCSANTSSSVFVKPRPISKFTMDTTLGCAPVAVKFKNISSGGNFYSWNYGDGNFSSLIESNHTFSTAMKDTLYSIRLIVENSASCRDTFIKQVHVFPVPKVSYTYTPSDQCYTPMYADFTNTSVGAQFYKWFFHDGITSLETNPTMSYTLPGKYEVTLRGENEFRCVDSVTHDVIKYPKPKANFTPDKLVGCIPLSVSFTNTSLGASKYNWDFGDGNAKNTKDASITYGKDGTFNVRLIVENSDKCTDTLTIPIIAHPIPTPDFSFKNTDPCFNPMFSEFENVTIGGDFYEWDFMNGLVSSLKSPKTKYTISGDYKVKLTAINKFNCAVSKEKVITMLQKPKSLFTINKLVGCIPFTVEFKNTSQFGTYYSWDFKDGNVSTQTDTKNTFMFADGKVSKDFNVQLISEGLNGCKDTSEQTITTLPLPFPSFNYTTSDPCYNPMIANFTNTSIDAKKYEWNFQNGSSSSLTNPKAIFTSSGTYDVMLIATNQYACNDTIRKKVVMKPKPRSNFTMDQEQGCLPLTISFTNTALGSDFNSWNFGDANSSADKSPVHTFTKLGKMEVQLIVENSQGCKDTIKKELTTFPVPIADFSFTTSDPCYIPMYASMKNLSTGATGYSWDFNNTQTSSLVDPTAKYTSSGTFAAQLTAINEFQCRNTISKNIGVNNKPKAIFSSDKTEGCMPLKVVFSNSSQGFSYSSWDFGDTNYSGKTNPIHVFDKAGTFTSSLIVENAQGCRDTVKHDYLIHPTPIADYRFTTSDLCYRPTHVYFTNVSVGAVSYKWDFDNGIESIQTSPKTFYNSHGTIRPMLEATTLFGCKDTVYKPIVFYPSPTIVENKIPSQLCAEDQSAFSVKTTYADSIVWHMGNGDILRGKVISYTYPKEGTYPIVVYAYGEGGCIDTLEVSNKITIHPDPQADFTHENVFIDGKKNGTIQFTNASLNTTEYLWKFGDGGVGSEKDPIHKYFYDGFYDITLIATNKFLCIDSVVKKIQVDFFKGLYVPNAMYLAHHDFEVSHFVPKGVGIKEYQLLIYDTWGNVIFETTKLDEHGRPVDAWDGYYMGVPVQQDAYVWKITALFRDESIWPGKEYDKGVIKMSGTVTVIRD